MTTQTNKMLRPDVPSAAACAEAAAWIARLHSTERTPAVEEGFRHWLTASPEHRAAFEMANDIWTDTERWPRPTTSTYKRWPKPAIILSYPRAALATLTIAALALVGALFYLRESGFSTQIGEQRNITLEDGTRVALNTATRIQVAYGDTVRRVELDRGEALFEVARNPNRPFIVIAGERQVRAIGTAFLVRRDSQEELEVTLVEGKVAVSKLPASGVAGLLAATESSAHRANDSETAEAGTVTASAATDAGTVVLAPGERLTFAGSAAPELDRPAVSHVTAWQRGQVILDHTPLSAAIEEMNRYSVIQLAIDQPTVAELEVTGVFRSGDSISFAQAVAETYHLKVVHEPRRIRLVQTAALSTREALGR